MFSVEDLVELNIKLNSGPVVEALLSSPLQNQCLDCWLRGNPSSLNASFNNSYFQGIIQENLSVILFSSTLDVMRLGNEKQLTQNSVLVRKQ